MTKNVIITGGSGNLGRFLVEKYSKQNFNIYNISRSKPKKIFDKESFLQCNLSKSKSVNNTLMKIKQKKIDFIISCSGNSKKNYSNTITEKEIISSIEDNLLSFMNIVEQYLLVFKNKKTSIIAISSIAANKIIDAPINYSISKNALNYYCIIKAKNLAKYKININIISPGNIYMKNNNWGKKIKRNPNMVKKYIKKHVPLNSFISPEQIYETCNYLTNKSNNLITGSNLIIDGGQSI